MTDLSHWDVCDLFTGMEAACLFVGVDPNVEPEHFASKPILRRMRTDYERELHAQLDALMPDDMRGLDPDVWIQNHLRSVDTSFFDCMVEEALSAVRKRGHLHSWRIHAYVLEQEDFFTGAPSSREEMLFDLATSSYERWLRRGIDTDFEHQLFHRVELLRWIEVHRYSSKYNFRLGDETDDTPGRVFPMLSRGKRGHLTSVIEIAASKCRNPWDVNEVWPALQNLARQPTPPPPLIGITEVGVQYLDLNDAPREFTKRALRERLRRSEY